MQQNDFNKRLDLELDTLRAAFPGVSFVPWHSEMTETTVVTVIPDTIIEDRDFVLAEMALCVRMYEAFPNEVVTFRSKDDEYFPYQEPATGFMTDYSGFWSAHFSRQLICTNKVHEGFEEDQLVMENTKLDTQINRLMLLIPRPISEINEEAFHQTEETEYCLAA